MNAERRIGRIVAHENLFAADFELIIGKYGTGEDCRS